MTEVTPPRGTSKLTSSSALTPWNEIPTPSIRSSASPRAWPFSSITGTFIIYLLRSSITNVRTQRFRRDHGAG